MALHPLNQVRLQKITSNVASHVGSFPCPPTIFRIFREIPPPALNIDLASLDKGKLFFFFLTEFPPQELPPRDTELQKSQPLFINNLKTKLALMATGTSSSQIDIGGDIRALLRLPCSQVSQRFVYLSFFFFFFF